MTDIVERLRFDAARCEATFSKGVASNIEDAAKEIERLRKIEKAARNVSDTLTGGFVRCSNCGDQEDTTDIDFAEELRVALGDQQSRASA